MSEIKAQEWPQIFSLEEKVSLRKVLVIRRGGIGDIILATPALRTLASRLPGARLDMLVQRGAAEALSGLPYINTIYEVDSRSNPVSLCRLHKLAHTLRARQYDLLVNYQPGMKTKYLARCAEPRFALTFAKDRSIQEDTGQVRHAIDDFVHTLAPLQLGPVCDRSLDFAVPDHARAHLNRLLGEAGYFSGGRERSLVVINPTARRVVNRWPAARWAQLIDTLCCCDEHRVVVIGAGRDLPTVREVKMQTTEWRRVIDLSNRINLKELGALLERAAVFVTGDTGPMHVGAAVGAPIVCLSGAANPDRTGPITRNSEVVIDRRLPCVPCQNKRCQHSSQPRCMEGIAVEQVLSAARRAINGASRIPVAVVER